MKHPQRRRILDLEAIVTTALVLVDETGDFSMPAIARKLGVSGPAMYHHVQNRAELVDLIRARLFEAHFEDFRSLEWPEAVRAWTFAYRKIFSSHPNLVNILVRYSIRDPRSLTAFDQLAQILEEAGVPQHEVIVWITLFDSFTLSIALFSVAPGEIWDATTHASPTLQTAIDAGPRQPELANAAFEVGLAGLIERLKVSLKVS